MDDVLFRKLTELDAKAVTSEKHLYQGMDLLVKAFAGLGRDLSAPGAKTPLPSELSAAERALVERMKSLRHVFVPPLPRGADALRRWLGEAPPSALEQLVAHPSVGSGSPTPLYRAIQSLFDDQGIATPELRPFVESLPVDVRVRAAEQLYYEEAERGCYGIDNWVFLDFNAYPEDRAVLDRIDAALAPWARETAARWTSRLASKPRRLAPTVVAEPILAALLASREAWPEAWDRTLLTPNDEGRSDWVLRALLSLPEARRRAVDPSAPGAGVAPAARKGPAPSASLVSFVERVTPTLKLTRAQAAQVVATGELYFSETRTAKQLVTGDDGDESFGSTVSLMTARVEGAAYDFVLAMGDSGAVFEAGTTERVAQIVQGGIEDAEPPLRRALEAALALVPRKKQTQKVSRAKKPTKAARAPSKRNTQKSTPREEPKAKKSPAKAVSAKWPRAGKRAGRKP